MPSFTFGVGPDGPTFPGLFTLPLQLIAPGSTPPAQTGLVLIDTGASISCIHPRVVAALQLTPVGKRSIAVVGQAPQQMDVYRLALFAGPIAVFPDLVVVGASLKDVDCLLGRDVLAHALFFYNGHMNQFTLAF